MRNLRTLSAAVTSMLVVAGLAFTGTTTVEAAVTDCDPVAIVAFRGSGEKNVNETSSTLTGTPLRYGDTGLVTNGWEGPTLQRVIATFASSAAVGAPAGFRPADVPVIGIGYDGSAGYPAIDTRADPLIFSDLVTSSTTGARHAAEKIKEFKALQPAGCGTKFLAVGYSQGAMASRTLEGLSRDVVGVVNLGDPYQKPNARGNETGAGLAPYGEGIVRSWAPGAKEILDDYYTRDADHKTAICHEKDPICSYNWILGLPSLKVAIGPHLNYGVDSAEARRKGQELADLAASFATRGGAPTPPRAAMDVVFAIDTTGSMYSYIDAARNTARTAAASIFGSARQGRVGLVEYRDHGDSFVSRTVVPLTDSADAFSAGLDALTPDGGGDWPEALISGVFESARADWNPAASKSIIVIADAPAHDPEPVTGYTLDQMGQVLTGSAPVPSAPPAARSFRSSEDRSQEPGLRGTLEDAPSVQRRSATNDAVADSSFVTLYGISADSSLTAQLEPIAVQTGGKVSGIDDATEVQELILEAIDDATAAPEALLSASPVQLTGLPIVLNAGDSTTESSAATYAFDLDGDGVFEIAQSDPTAEVTYDSAGARKVSVQVTDARGRTATAAVDLDVLAQETATVQPVDPADATTALTGGSLSAPTTSASNPALLTLSDGLREGERAGARLVAAGPGDPWAKEAVQTFELSETGSEGVQASLTPAAAVGPGTYDLLVLTDAGRHAEFKLQVVDDITVVPVPAVPQVNDPAGPNNAQWIVPADDETYAWQLGQDGTLTVTIRAANVTFPDGSTSYSYGRATDSTLTIVPVAPTRSGNTVTIPRQDGVVYRDARGRQLSGEVDVKRAGLTVTATPAAGVFFAEGAQTKWVYSYQSAPRPGWVDSLLAWILGLIR